MTPTARLLAGIGLVLAVVVLGSAGFMIVEHLGALDAVYMTIISISTVGFREVGGDLTSAGKVLTMAVILSGTGAALYTAVGALEFMFENVLGGRIAERKMMRRIDDLSGHVILCGYGRVGGETWRHLVADGAEIVVIDVEPAAVQRATAAGAFALLGDATQDDLLEGAGIDRAKTVIAAVASDSDNLVITLSAKAKQPDVFVISRALDAESERKLYLAGADRVVTPQLVGAQRLASLATHPNLIEFIDLVVRGHTVEFRVEEVIVSDHSRLAGVSLRDSDLRRRSGALVLAMGNKEATMAVNPAPEQVIEPGYTLVAIGTADQLDRLRGEAGRA